MLFQVPPPILAPALEKPNNLASADRAINVPKNISVQFLDFAIARVSQLLSTDPDLNRKIANLTNLLNLAGIQTDNPNQTELLQLLNQTKAGLTSQSVVITTDLTPPEAFKLSGLPPTGNVENKTGQDLSFQNGKQTLDIFINAFNQDLKGFKKNSSLQAEISTFKANLVEKYNPQTAGDLLNYLSGKDTILYNLIFNSRDLKKIRDELEKQGAESFSKSQFSQSKPMPTAEQNLGLNLAEMQNSEFQILELIRIEQSIEKQKLLGLVILVKRAIVANVEGRIRMGQPIPKRETTMNALSKIDEILIRIKGLDNISGADAIRAELSEIATQAIK